MIKIKMMQKEKIVLAYSGGLDTTYCAVYLSKIKNYDVHAVTINTGAFSANEIKILEEKAQRRSRICQALSMPS